MALESGYIKGKNKNGYVLKCFNVQVGAGFRGVREHKHSMFEIAVIKQGSGIYRTSKGDFPIEKGDVFVFSSNEQHCIIDITKPLHIMNLQFEPRFFWGSDYESFSNSSLFFEHSADFSSRLEGKDERTGQIRQLLSGIENEFLDKNAEYKMVVRSLLTDILVILIRQFSYSAKVSKNSSANIKAVKTAINYIHNHLTEPITLEQIASKVGMSKSYFSTVFRDTLGETLWDYVNEKRIELAMRRLDSAQDETMLQIALECGFNNTANFNKAFKKQTAKTPREYKIHGNSVLY